MDVEMVTDAAQSAPVPAPTTPASAGSPGTLKHGEPRRRNRPALSCIQCRTRKIRCDRNEPCASCMKSKIVNCTYEEARRPKPRLWRLSPTSADERAAANSAFTFRDMALPVPPPTSNPPCTGPGSGAAPPLGKTPEPRSAASPRSLPQMLHHAEPGAGTSGPLGNTTALAERVRQLEQQLADALKRPDYGSPSARSAHQTLSPDLGPPSRPSRVNSWMNGEKLVGHPFQPPPCPGDSTVISMARNTLFPSTSVLLPIHHWLKHLPTPASDVMSCRADCPTVSPRCQYRRAH